MAHQHERTAARKCAAQILYTGAIRGESSLALLEAGDLSESDILNESDKSDVISKSDSGEEDAV